MKGRQIFINPVLVIQKGDFLGSGVPYMPHILAYTVGLLKSNKINCEVIDAFGLDPKKITSHGNFYWQGIEIEEILGFLNSNLDLDTVFIYSSAITNVEFNLLLIKKIKKLFPGIRIVLLANTQAVTSFDVTFLSKSFLKNGVDIIVYNNIESTVLELIKCDFKIDKNVIYYDKSGRICIGPMTKEIGTTDQLVLPAWEKFPIKNYWKLGYSHGPMQAKYLPLLTSYGCPFRCKFCVNSGVNKSRWQAKPANFVFKEIKYLVEKFKVNEFHLEDLDPTVDKKRIEELCNLILKSNLKIKWKIVSGTKVETIDKNVLWLMKKSGCNYISISPETGSLKVLDLMHKKFDYSYANEIIRYCKKIGIRTQACFVVGFPGEDRNDRTLTTNYIFQLTKIGIDEIALFIATPLPGSGLFIEMGGYKQFSSLTFSPKWRTDYLKLAKYRQNLYKKFLWWKLIYHPVSILYQGINFLSKNFMTKMEMMPFRIIKFDLLLLRNHDKI